jgi:hypothetical protein
MRNLLFFVLIWYNDDEVECEVGGRYNRLKNMRNEKERLLENKNSETVWDTLA